MSSLIGFLLYWVLPIFIWLSVSVHVAYIIRDKNRKKQKLAKYAHSQEMLRLVGNVYSSKSLISFIGLTLFSLLALAFNLYKSVNTPSIVTLIAVLVTMLVFVCLPYIIRVLRDEK